MVYTRRAATYTVLLHAAGAQPFLEDQSSIVALLNEITRFNLTRTEI